MKEERSLSLLQLMVNEGLVPSPEEEENRKTVIEKLKQNLDILNPVFLRDIDETGWKSLSRVLANTQICRLVPDLKDLLKFDFDWHNVLEPFPYTKKYAWFLKIFLSASKQDELGDWVGWIKSRFCCLLFKLEEVQGLCDPNPAEYIDVNIADPHVIFYWGLQAGKTNAIDIKSVKDVFWRNISTGYQGPFGKIELSIVQASQVPKSAQFDTLSQKKKACWKMMDYHQRRIPIYSQHVPQYIVGYVSTNGDPEYPSAGV